MQKRDGRVDPTFTARKDVIRMLREYSPVTHVAAGDPPTILIHGDQDKAVPVQQSRRLIERLNDAKVPAGRN
jgi:dipeptidyl aminopeptidase/acylaminoacyl peptidase